MFCFVNGDLIKLHCGFQYDIEVVMKLNIPSKPEKVHQLLRKV